MFIDGAKVTCLLSLIKSCKSCVLFFTHNRELLQWFFPTPLSLINKIWKWLLNNQYMYLIFPWQICTFILAIGEHRMPWSWSWWRYKIGGSNLVQWKEWFEGKIWIKKLKKLYFLYNNALLLFRSSAFLNWIYVTQSRLAFSTLHVCRSIWTFFTVLQPKILLGSHFWW